MNTEDKIETITAYKGFDQNWQCRGYQFEVGKTYTHVGPVKVCESGFHACEYPLDIFSYYEPANNQFAIVEQSGDIACHEEDSKIASRTISIKSSIDLHGLIKAAIEYTIVRTKPIDPNSQASNSGYMGAASNSGDRGAASNSGNRGAASNSGYMGAASNSGDMGAASNSGTRGAASNSGNRGVAADFNGICTKVMSCESGAIVCINRDEEGNIRHIRASKVGDNGIKQNTWYSLDENGDFMEVSE